MKKLKKIMLITFVLVLTFTAGACQKKESESETTTVKQPETTTATEAEPVTATESESVTATESKASETKEAGTSDGTSDGTVKVRQIVVGTGNAFNPLCYLDDKGNLTGFEYEFLKKVDEALPQYEFTFESAEFASILVGLDAGKYDIAAHYYAKNPEREEKYLYGKEPYQSSAYRIAVLSGNTALSTLKDLEGKTIEVSTGSNVAYLLETYNETAEAKINLIYGDGTTEVVLKNLKDGRTDAYITTERSINDINKSYDVKLEANGDVLLPVYTYYIFSREDTQLRDDVDTVISQFREDGTLTQVSIDTMGGDYTQLIPGLEK